MIRPAATCSLALAIVSGPLGAAAAPSGHHVTPCETAVRGDMRAKSYETVMHSDHEGTAVTETIDIQKPDRFHTISQGREMIAIGQQQWVQYLNSWHLLQTLPGMQTQKKPATSDPAKAFADKPNFVCKDDGRGTWRGESAHVYKSLYSSNNGPVETTMYVMPDGYIHHVDIRARNGTTSFDYSRFNAIHVDPPVVAPATGTKP